MTIEELREKVQHLRDQVEHEQLAVYARYAVGAFGTWDEAVAAPTEELRRIYTEDDFESFPLLNGEQTEWYENDEGQLDALSQVLALFDDEGNGDA